MTSKVLPFDGNKDELAREYADEIAEFAPIKIARKPTYTYKQTGYAASDGLKRYHTVIRIKGKRQWGSFARKKDAEGYLDRNSTDIREGTYRELKPATFAEYIAHWRATHLLPQQFKPSTFRSYSTILDRH